MNSPSIRISVGHASGPCAMPAGSFRRPSPSCIPHRPADPRPDRRCSSRAGQASAIAASLSALPRSESSAARALSARRADIGQRDAPPRQRSRPSSRSVTAAAAVAKSPDLALELGVAVAGARRGHRDADLGQDLIGLRAACVGCRGRIRRRALRARPRSPLRTKAAPSTSISAG